MTIKIVNKIYEILTLIFIFLAPFIFIPLFSDPYEFGRLIFVLTFSFIIFILYCVRSYLEKSLAFKKNSYLLFYFFLLSASIVSSLVNSPNKLSSLASPLGALGILLVLFTIFLISTVRDSHLYLYPLLAGGLLTSLSTLFLFFAKFSYPLNFPSLGITITKAWSPTGSLLSQTIFLLALVPLGLGLITEYLHNQKTIRALVIFAATLIILLGIGIGFYLLNTEAKPIILPHSVAWVIAVEGLKTARTALLGVGPARFITAFSSFRPLYFNNSNYWNIRFGSSSNFYLHLLTETGLIALVLYLLITAKVFKNAWKFLREPKISPVRLALKISLVVFFVAQFLVPINFSLFILIAILIGLSESNEDIKLDLSPLGKLVLVFFVIPLVIWTLLLYYGAKISIANYFFNDSLKSIAKNDGVRAYNSQIKAIQYDQNNIGYRIAYSQTNLALANALAGQQNLSDNDRNTITQLIQQAIREAKAAVSLDTGNPVAWENLSSLYRNLINFAQGADQWAIASYQEAIKTDPLNPTLRLDLGGIYYSLKNYNQAAGLFLQATNLKPDYANAYYNLANAYRELGAYAEAKRAYEITQTLVPADSNDFQKVVSELQEVEKKLPSPTPTPSSATAPAETLSKPSIPETKIQPKLEIPEEGPPITPSPNPNPPETP